MDNKTFNVVGVILTFIGIIAMVAFLLGAPLMVLWNWLVPSIFGIREITFWEAVGLNLLSGVLFGKIGNPSSSK